MELISETRRKVHTYTYVWEEQEAHRLHARDWSCEDDFMPFLDEYVEIASETSSKR